MSRIRTSPSRGLSARQLLLAVGVLLAASGCGSRSSVRSPFDGPVSSGSSAEDPIQVDVQNLNFNDVTIWAMRQGQRIRLGRVTGKTDQTFRIDWNLALPISFVIDVVGGRGCRTGQIGVDRNSKVWIAIPSNVGTQPCRVGRR